MGRFDSVRNQFVRGADVTFFAAAARTADANSAAERCDEYSVAHVTLSVTARSGTTPTLDVKLQTSANGTDWTDLTPAFTQVTGSTTLPFTERKTIAGLQEYVRAVWDVGGTSPSFTGSVSGYLK